LKNLENKLLVILGPTASGKTNLAVKIASKIEGEVISADSRQVYKGMDIGTGKDLNEYETFKVPFHLIDLVPAGEKYFLGNFQQDFFKVFKEIQLRNHQAILCGGTGLYIQSVLLDFWQTQIPNDLDFRKSLEQKSYEELLNIFKEYKTAFKFDTSTIKRLTRAIEILEYLIKNSDFKPNVFQKPLFKIYGLSPSLENRREKISKRLKERIEHQGLITEVENLLNDGVSENMLLYYGLEYRYICEYLKGKRSYKEMYDKLEVEIHRFAKRQMTFFRSLEKKDIKINWIPNEFSEEEKIDYVIADFKE